MIIHNVSREIGRSRRERIGDSTSAIHMAVSASFATTASTETLNGTILGITSCLGDET